MHLTELESEQVPLNTNMEHSASPPEPEPTWRGIVIRAPATVMLNGKSPDGAFARAPICGFFMLDAASAPATGSITLVARDLATQQEFRGSIGESDASPDEPPPDDIPPRDPASLEGISVEGFFNPNLARYVDLPRAPATYEVWAEWGGVRSNVLQIRFVRP